MFIQTCSRFLLLASIILSTACAFYPTTSKQQDHANKCNMATRSLDLEYDVMIATGCGGSNEEAAACLAIMGIVIPIGTLVASGSIVLVGNTLHWLEYHGTCDDGLLWSYIEGSK
jgi:hypothetical protein